MFPAIRQEKLNTVLKALAVIPGVSTVQQDDFDSVSIRVHISLDCSSRRGGMQTGKAMRFSHELSSTKAKIKSVLHKLGFGFQFSLSPTLQYTSSYSTWTRKTEKFRNGYDFDYISVDLSI